MTRGRLFGVISVYGLLISAGILLCVWLCSRRGRRRGLGDGIGIDMALWTVLPGIIGARLYYVVFQWPVFAADPIRILYVWEGGLAIYGAILGGAAGLYAFSVRGKQPFGRLLDVAAPALPLAQALGRWGNFFNGEAYGCAVENAAWQFFPAAVQIGSSWYMATFFYESVWDALCGAWLLVRDRKRGPEPDGVLFACYLVLYGAGRMVVEELRTDSLMLSSLRVSQVLACVMCAGGLLFAVRKGRGQNRRLTMALAAAGTTLFALSYCVPARLLFLLLSAAVFLLAAGLPEKRICHG